MEPFKHIISKTGKAIADFNLIEDGDRILVALSGGKDSWALLHVLYALKKKAPVNFKLYPVTVHPGFPDFSITPALGYLRNHFPDLSHSTEATNISELLARFRTPGKSICSFCSRLRRGILYRIALRNNFNKIALGHHADDIIETLLLNQFFNGRIKAMSPILHSDDGKNKVIRPLCYVSENEIYKFSKTSGVPIINENCPLSGKEHNRSKMKKLLAKISKEFPGIKSSLLSSLSAVDTRHLMDTRFWQDGEY